jgi:hypothetical protein
MNSYELLQEAVEAWPQFDSNEHVSGADLAAWFADWRQRAKEELLRYEAQK